MLLDYIFAISNMAASGSLVYAVDQKFKNDAFALHPIMAVSGVSTILSASYLMTQSKRLAAAKNRCPYKNVPGPLQMHQYAMYAGALSLLYALRVIYREKESKGQKHLKSTHSKIGAASIIGVVTMALVSTGVLSAPPESKCPTKALWRTHFHLGRAGLLALGAAAATGAYNVFGNTQKFQGIVGALGVAIAAVEIASIKKRGE